MASAGLAAHPVAHIADKPYEKEKDHFALSRREAPL
jgi:hypothetical protein